MTDLLQVLPAFSTAPYTHLLPSLDKALISTNDLITLEAADVAKRAQVPVGDLRKLADAVVDALHRSLGFGGEETPSNTFLSAQGITSVVDDGWRAISTLDDTLDAALGGGIPPGYLVEVTGESGAGKTQLLLTLLLAVQLPPPHGLNQSAIYISTEAPLATTRLTQLLSTHPLLSSLPPKQKPSLSRILSIQTPDLESQEHILRYQLPVAIKKHAIGLVVLDSVAANYRAEFEKKGPRDGAASMAKRGTQLVQLGALLRDIARTEGVAFVVANQVADRFSPSYTGSSSTSNAASRTTSTNSQGPERSQTPLQLPQNSPNPHSQAEDIFTISGDPLALDHQQRWFTGWGDEQFASSQSLKTPSLGLVWTNQLSCRIALHKQPVYANRPLVLLVNGEDQWNEEENHISKWRRWLKVVFASWAAPTDGRGVEYEVLGCGVRAVLKES